MPKSKAAGLTRRQMLKVGGAATFAGYAVGVEKALGQAIKTDTQGIVAGDAEVAIGGYQMPVYEARPASATNAPIIIVISEIWGVHEWVRTSPGASPGRLLRGGPRASSGKAWAIPNVQDILNALAVPRKQLLATAPRRTGLGSAPARDRAGVTGHRWGGSKLRWRRPTPTTRRRWRGTRGGPAPTPRR